MPSVPPTAAPSTAVRPLPRLIRPVLIGLLVLTAGLAAIPPAAGQQPPAVTSPSPAPHAVVEAGPVRVTASLTPAGADAEVLVDGGDPVPLPPEGAVVELDAGGHELAVRVAGEVVRSWPVHAAGLRAAQAPADLVELGLAAARADDAVGERPAVLINPDRPDLALASGPLAVALGATVLPTRADAVGESALAALDALGGPVVVLGGLDAIGDPVLAQLRDAGHDVRRVGSGDAVAVAAAAAAVDPVADRYARDGRPTTRPALLAPASPLTAAVQAAASAARSGASLVLTAPAALSDDAADVLADRDVVWVDDALSPPVRRQAAEATGGDVDVRSTRPGPAKEAWLADADDAPAAAVLATRAAGHGVAVVTDDALPWVARGRPAAATAVGPVSAADVRAAWVDGPAAPSVDVRVTDPAGPVLELRSSAAVDGAGVHVTVRGREWPGTTTVEGDVVRWTAGARPSLGADEPSGPQAVPLAVTGVVAAGGHLRHVAASPEVVITPTTSTSPEGFTVAGGTSPVVGDGPLRTFTVEVEPATGRDVAAVTAEVTGILLDAERGWSARGERSLQRVADPAAADVRVVLARPETVDRFCRRVGLDTAGRLSCWDGARAMLNLTRWDEGVAPFHTDLEVYRRYLVSHEVGHGLGYGHVPCPGAGQLAPVMMQQSKGLGGCEVNGWPYPQG